MGLYQEVGFVSYQGSNLCNHAPAGVRRAATGLQPNDETNVTHYYMQRKYPLHRKSDVYESSEETKEERDSEVGIQPCLCHLPG